MVEIDIVAISNVLNSLNYVTFDDLHLRRSSQEVVDRFLLLDAKNINKDGQFMGIMLLLLDEKGVITDEGKSLQTKSD
ncbi:unnamed protein product [Microthlaspi erraticum]|uniref:Uncharacterized protein n=1 Tax=Microthlaspi erraticum TaxID=1685480 RepID=A0A6D2JVQ0_9BRAS|nr:unnamed protein product [Microthlaspi erraticum]